MKTILAAVDFSPGSARVVEEAATLARALHARLVLATVLIEPVYLKEFAPPPPRVAQITVAHERAVRARLAALQTTLRARSIPTTVVVRCGQPAVELLAEAAKRNPAYLVIGSHGHTAFYDLLLGSTAQTILKRAQRPVVVISSVAQKSGRK